ncbi:TetR family transcriptional regulator [Glycomyces sp. TRM65418]|uniref:TetR/AcrR family transcriptional regulator n=1 Tax=Glycomyces sp. TRM65418 TaxID=2867006 RepID=UPI001CE59FD8|nr:TetR family transcriptional regulator [Glycomyces sp. TRM65418]MCC3765392.1 TetR family transcriptional regulator [Glycomyces sp. TRM65418]QZD55005.1 TetR family transcriptional regulator [Glycomyces sp. TRM65418]
MARSKRAGRRSGNPDTKAEILAAARRLFAEEGFESVSMRRIASEAGVDPSLIHHYFGSKNDLFLAAIELPLDPAPEVAAVLEGGEIEGVGERLMHAFVTIWDGPHQEKLLAVVRTSLSKPAMSFVLRQMFEHRIVKTVEEAIGDRVDHVPVRANFIGSQIFGLVVTRYILKLEPIASLGEAELAETIGPTIDRYLTMPVEHLVDRR